MTQSISERRSQLGAEPAISLTALPDDVSGLHSVGRLPMRALQRPVAVELDGTWDFLLLPHADAGMDREWASAVVPGMWTMSEPSDPPQYLNVRMPFDEVPPSVPVDNPIGLYRRRFQAPVVDGRVILRIGAAEGFLRVYINDRLVGTNNDSHLEAEFDISEAIEAGENTLLLALTKWSAVSYLEDQDHWWQAGLSRSVSLHMIPRISLTDVKVTADFDADTGSGSLHVEAVTAGYPDATDPKHIVQIRVLGQVLSAPVTPYTAQTSLNTSEAAKTTDRSVRPEPLIPPDIMEFFSDIPSGAPIPPEWAESAESIKQMYLVRQPLPGTATVSLTDLTVKPWSAERPHLEELVVELLDQEGRTVDTTTIRIGFRRISIDGRDLLVNGRRILIQGVNRHDSHPKTGRVLTRDELKAELSQLKTFNFNAIRTSHYPNDPEFLDLCDEYGFYVVDEANIETHAFMDAISDDPGYLPAFVERVSRMVLRDRNHPCIVAWSLGNESGYGANHDAAAAWARGFDPTRPVHYEGAVSKDWHGGHAATDIACPMYPTPRSLISYSEDPRSDRPLILSEYAYSQGNGTGGFARYWELFESLPGLQGGFIWQYLDHALDPDGDGHYRSGADFGNRPNDSDLMLNGIAFADRTPKPAMYEARAIFSPVRILSTIQDAVNGSLLIRNRQTFADLSQLTLSIHVDTRDGAAAKTGLSISAEAGQETAVVLPEIVKKSLSSKDALGVTLTVMTKGDTEWAPAGTVIAEQQLAWPVNGADLPVGRGLPDVDELGNIRHPFLRRAPELSLWRALTDNDKSVPLDQRFVRSGFFKLTAVERRVEPQGEEGTRVIVKYAAAFGDPVIHERLISVIGKDDYVFTESVTLPEDTSDGLRVGVVFELDEGFDHASWLGLGPGENYPDRKASARFGAWESKIDDLSVQYMPPQENGGRGEVTGVRLSGNTGSVVTSHESPLQVNIGRYTAEQLEAVAHWWELPPSSATIVHLDIAHRGLGTAVLGPDTAPPFRLDGNSYTWRWRLTLKK